MAMKNLDLVLSIFIGLILVFSAVNFLLISARSQQIKEAALIAEKENEPAKIELVKITASSCDECFDINTVVENLKKANVNVTSERVVDFSSPEAEQLINQYNIEKLPTVIVLGEVNKSAIKSQWNQNWQVEMKDGTPVSAFYSAVALPYMDASGNIKGLITLTSIVDETCSQCANLEQVIGFFKQQGAKFSNEKTVDFASSEATDLIARFGIQKVPALIISKDILDYPAIAQVWDQLNATENEGFYALHTTVPPYRNLATNKIEGLVSVVYLTDDSCTGCYDVTVNRQILERNYRLAILNETMTDVSSAQGSALLQRYNITKVPVFLASPEAKLYMAFVQVWPQVGSIESDGWFVMRRPDVLGTYKDLATGEITTLRQSGG